MESARSKAELGLEAVEKARNDSVKAKQQAREGLRSEPNISGPSGEFIRLHVLRLYLPNY